MDYQGMRTYRRFHQEPVPEAVLGEMMENVRIASCAKNDQPLIYTVVRSAEMVKAMQPSQRSWGRLWRGSSRPPLW